jgi:2-keto-4-pentenoate hydratase/2-oxohepta-3-ene-1,7-dioic acid hydratase in catechol pathway
VRLATIQTDDGPLVVGVDGDAAEMRYVPLQRADSSIPRSLKALLAQTDGLARAATAFERGRNEGLFVSGRLLAPIACPGKVICIGLNYRDHAEESGMPIPEEPICFGKFSSAVVGPEDPVQLPAVAKKVDYEAELVVVIGKLGRNIPESEARSYVAGYMNGNDVSARDWQIGRPGGQWLLGKTPDTFAPTGPYLVTADEVPDPEALSIRLRLNGETMQDSSTKELIFGVDRLIAHLSQLMTLEPGDILFTGTPPGVGAARKPPVFIKPGDTMEVEVEGLGVLRNPVEVGG